MTRIDDLLRELAPHGVEYKQLGEVGRFIRGNGLQKKDLLDAGVPAIHYGQIHTAYAVWTTETVSYVTPDFASRLRKAEPGNLVIATTSEDDEAVAKATAWLGEVDAVVSGDAYIYRHTLDPKYMAYFFQSEHFQSQKKTGITGTKVRRISGDSLAKIRIPVPPLEVQREIVRILDAFTELGAELEAELEARRQQYAHYRDALLASDGREDWSTLGEVCTKVINGGTPLSTRREYYDGGSIPWLRTQEVRYLDIYDTDVKITETGFANSAVKWVPEGSVIVAISGAGVTRGRVAVNKIPVTTNQHCCSLVVDPAKAHYRYVFHWLFKQYEELRSRGQGNRSDLNVGIIKAFPIPLPSVEKQRWIAEALDRFDALTSDLSSGLPAEIEARRQQYAYYRDRLFTFEEAAA